MFSQQRTVRAEKERCAIQRATVALDDAYRQEQPGASHSAANTLGFRLWHDNRGLEIAAKLIAPFGCAAAKKNAKIGPFG